MRVGIIGAPGRMSQRLVTVCNEDADMTVSMALARPGSAAMGRKLGELPGFPDLDILVSETISENLDVIIDFSSPAATAKHVLECARLKIPVVIGTTGLTEAEEALIDEAGESIAVLTASNTSLGVNLLEGLVEQLAKSLGVDYDIEIVESHHKWKKDAPSGTALFLAKAAARGLEQDLSACIQNGREGRETQRKVGEIGVHALRMGDVVGEHRVYFSALGERLEIGHIATSRDTFARGAARAAKFLVGKAPGRYSMKDVLAI
ncbi:MAG: 4-hydroxy-tetrahydrodipicolinate reductase [Planctomycetota bacterium]|nr:4-hydroxy-tetrahydrodipicolinate reductase [Planctomycetota bacterium]